MYYLLHYLIISLYIISHVLLRGHLQLSTFSKAYKNWPFQTPPSPESVHEQNISL